MSCFVSDKLPFSYPLRIYFQSHLKPKEKNKLSLEHMQQITDSSRRWLSLLMLFARTTSQAHREKLVWCVHKMNDSFTAGKISHCVEWLQSLVLLLVFPGPRQNIMSWIGRHKNIWTINWSLRLTWMSQADLRCYQKKIIKHIFCYRCNLNKSGVALFHGHASTSSYTVYFIRYI